MALWTSWPEHPALVFLCWALVASYPTCGLGTLVWLPQSFAAACLAWCLARGVCPGRKDVQGDGALAAGLREGGTNVQPPPRQLLTFWLGDSVAEVQAGGERDWMGSRFGTDIDAIRWRLDATFSVPSRGSPHHMCPPATACHFKYSCSQGRALGSSPSIPFSL